MKSFGYPYKLVSTAQGTSTSPFNSLSLLSGLFALVLLTAIAQRTALRGTSALDPLVLAPGLHLQPTANDLHKGEYPACAALTSGYTFRVENPATVYFLQRVGRTNCLTDLEVSVQASTPRSLPTRNEALASAGYYAAFGCNLFATQRVYALEDIWGLFFIINLMLTRLTHLCSAAAHDQAGPAHPNQAFRAPCSFYCLKTAGCASAGQLIICKVLTSGKWLRGPTTLDSFLGAVAMLLVSANVAFAGNATAAGVYTIASMLLVNGGLMALENLWISRSNMYGRSMEVVGGPKRCPRRRDLAEQLNKESGRDDNGLHCQG